MLWTIFSMILLLLGMFSLMLVMSRLSMMLMIRSII